MKVFGVGCWFNSAQIRRCCYRDFVLKLWSCLSVFLNPIRVASGLMNLIRNVSWHYIKEMWNRLRHSQINTIGATHQFLNQLGPPCLSSTILQSIQLFTQLFRHPINIIGIPETGTYYFDAGICLFQLPNPSPNLCCFLGPVPLIIFHLGYFWHPHRLGLIITCWELLFVGVGDLANVKRYTQNGCAAEIVICRTNHVYDVE